MIRSGMRARLYHWRRIGTSETKAFQAVTKRNRLKVSKGKRKALSGSTQSEPPDNLPPNISFIMPMVLVALGVALIGNPRKMGHAVPN